MKMFNIQPLIIWFRQEKRATVTSDELVATYAFLSSNLC